MLGIKITKKGILNHKINLEQLIEVAKQLHENGRLLSGSSGDTLSCLRDQGCVWPRAGCILPADNAICVSWQEPSFYRQQLSENIKFSHKIRTF